MWCHSLVKGEWILDRNVIHEVCGFTGTGQKLGLSSSTSRMWRQHCIAQWDQWFGFVVFFSIRNLIRLCNVVFTFSTSIWCYWALTFVLEDWGEGYSVSKSNSIRCNRTSNMCRPSCHHLHDLIMFCISVMWCRKLGCYLVLFYTLCGFKLQFNIKPAYNAPCTS